MTTPASIEAELDGEIADELRDLGLVGGGSRSRPTGALAEAAEFAASFAADGAVLVTLLQGPATVRALAAAIARRRTRRVGYWLRLRGPGGQATVMLSSPLDAASLEGLLAAIWQLPDQDQDD